jgi:hypothetical protein
MAVFEGAVDDSNRPWVGAADRGARSHEPQGKGAFRGQACGSRLAKLWRRFVFRPLLVLLP